MKHKLPHELSDIIEDIRITAALLSDKGWSEAGGGNISIRVRVDFPTQNAKRHSLPFPVSALKEKTILITRSGSRMREMAVNPEKGLCLMRIESDGSGYWIYPKDAHPTTELFSHLLVQGYLLEESPEYGTVLHTQPTAVVALTHILKPSVIQRIDQALFRMHPETAVLIPERTVILPYEVPGTIRLATITAEAIRGRRIVIWEKHGTISVGKSLSEAVDYVEVIEKAAEIYLAVRSTGNEPMGISDKDIKRTLSVFGLE